jgi:hypothetical protein
MSAHFYSGQFFAGEFFFSPAPPAIEVVAQPGGMIGGLGYWTTEFPRLPQKKEYVFRRNMENVDRTDIKDIVNILTKSGIL